ncbi:MAG TPA: hypothetical protein VK897_03045 [Anaerolineales bacterium]|nr:hypothetical protein [Anaerolineales bacterium]
MKRRTLMIIIVILSLLLIVVPANASTLDVDRAADLRNSSPVQKSSNNSLADMINTLPEGFHEFHFEGRQNQFSCLAVGWTADPDDRDADLNVRVFSDGVEVAQTVAGMFRQDLEDAGVCEGGTCHFSVDLWGLISPDVDHLITVQAQDAQTGEWVDLSTTPRTLHCFEDNFPLEGYHDAWEGLQNPFFCVAEGWAIDQNDRDLDLTVRVLSDGAEVAQTVSGRYRPDLEEAGVCPGGTCSFYVHLAGLISPGVDHLITVQAQDAQSGEWADLFNTPKTLNCLDVGARPIAIDGFGDGGNFAIEALEVFKGKLYAGASNFGAGATIWRSGNGGTWTQVTEPGFGSAYGANNGIVFDMFVFQNQLYAGTGFWEPTTTAGQIWRTSNGTTWHQVAADGLGDPNNSGFTTFASFKGMIYAAALNRATGAEIWHSNTGKFGDWQQVVTSGFGADPAYFVITSLTVFKGQLYATIEATPGNGAQVWRSANGTDWTQVSEDGFGDIDNYQTGGAAVFRGQLYVTTLNDVTGGQLWRSTNGTQWHQVVGDGFGDAGNRKIESLVVYNGALYAVANNPVAGVEIRRSTDGVNWTQVNVDGFGEGGTFSGLWSNGPTVFQGKLLLGSSGPFGGAIWQLQR